MNIGDHGHWDKRTLYETNARVPLIIRDPDIPESFGANASALVENVDIFPTLIEMAGLPDPKDRVFPPLEGACVRGCVCVVCVCRGMDGWMDWPSQ